MKHAALLPSLPSRRLTIAACMAAHRNAPRLRPGALLLELTSVGAMLMVLMAAAFLA